MTTAPDPHFPEPRPAEMTPAERTSAVAAALATGLLRHLHPALFPAPTAITDSQEFVGESP